MAKTSRFADLPTAKKQKNGKDFQYVYFLRIGDPQERLFKIGTTNDPRRRMLEHERNYKKPVTVLWLSPKLRGRFTSLKVEEDNKEKWIAGTNWEYLRNDRFIIPPEVDSVKITIKKDYLCNLHKSSFCRTD
mgnify:CR=1 FL=1